eukprot:2266410-Rhodomonas_salina.1
MDLSCKLCYRRRCRVHGHRDVMLTVTVTVTVTVTGTVTVTASLEKRKQDSSDRGLEGRMAVRVEEGGRGIEVHSLVQRYALGHFRACRGTCGADTTEYYAGIVPHAPIPYWPGRGIAEVRPDIA